MTVESRAPEGARAGTSFRAERRSHVLLEPWFVAALDAVAINLAFYLAWFARYELEIGAELLVQNYVEWDQYSSIQLALTVVTLIVFRLQGLYRLRRGTTLVDEVGILFNGTLVGIAIMIVGVFYLRPFGLSRLVFVYAAMLIVIILTLVRYLYRAYRGYLRRRGIGLHWIIVVGTGPLGRLIMQNVVAQPELGYQIAGFIDDERTEDIGRFRSLGKTVDLIHLLERTDVDEVVIALPSRDHALISQLMLACAQRRVAFRIVPDFFELSLNQVDIVDINGVPLIGVRQTQLSASGQVTKRAIDVVGALLSMVILAPLLVVVALLIKLDSPGPIMVRQTRIGRGGRPFEFLKLRSMYVGAESALNQIRHLDESGSSGRIFKARDDPRRTRVGRWLRRFSIDELPQVLNVLRGEMSLVGPRPPFPHEVERYEDWHRRRLEVLPGITGLWQVSGRSNLTFDEMALLDIWYIENWSIGLDMKILFRTPAAVALGTGAY